MKKVDWKQVIKNYKGLLKAECPYLNSKGRDNMARALMNSCKDSLVFSLQLEESTIYKTAKLKLLFKNKWNKLDTIQRMCVVKAFAIANRMLT